jgi:hypothetical protein
MSQTNRRQFFSTLAAASGVLAGSSPSAPAIQSSSALFHEAARDLPFNSDADVTIHGAGPLCQ